MKRGGKRTGRLSVTRWVSGVLCAGLCVQACAANLEDVVATIKPSIVGVGTYQRTRSPAFRFMGTGFAVGGGNHIATNAHVIPANVAEDQMETLVVAQSDGEQVAIRKASRVAMDRSSDLAVLRIEGTPLPVVSLAEGNLVRDGRSVAFTGFPIGSALGLTPVTHRGIISAVTPISIPQANSRDLNPVVIKRLSQGAFRVYQLDATSYPGNSGSPLYDAETGEVLGVLNMAFVKSTKENVLSDPSGISYAIPIAYLRALLAEAK